MQVVFSAPTLEFSEPTEGQSFCPLRAVLAEELYVRAVYIYGTHSLDEYVLIFLELMAKIGIGYLLSLILRTRLHDNLPPRQSRVLCGFVNNNENNNKQQKYG